MTGKRKTLLAMTGKERVLLAVAAGRDAVAVLFLT